jgi:TrwC relaxase
LRDNRGAVTFANVQTTHKISGDSAAGYAAYLTSSSSRGDYYTADGESDEQSIPPSRWHASPATLDALGLTADAQVKRDELRAVMQGLSPADGSPIRPVGADGSRVAGIDLTFSPPKTVSALWATSG